MSFGKQTTVIFLGDSQIKRLIEQFKLHKHNVVNLAVSGANVHRALQNLNDYIDSNKTEISKRKEGYIFKIVIFLGSNDLRSVESSHDFNRYEFKKIINISRKLFNHVYLLQLPLIPKYHHKWEVIRKINKYIASFHSARGIRIVDTRSIFPPETPDSGLRLRYFHYRYGHGGIDCIHMNPRGLTLIWALLQNYLCP